MNEQVDASDGDAIERVRRIDELCDRFEDQLRAGRRPSIEDFLRAEEIDFVAADSDLMRELARVESAYPHAAADLGETRSGSGSPPASAGRYELGEEIARGGMGIVYRARDLVLDREVGLKTLLHVPAKGNVIAKRFLDEARITGQLQHPNIPPVHDLGILPDGRPFLAMKLVKGLTLDALLKDRIDPADEPGRYLAIFEQIAQGVAYAHSHRVVHRDLKPLNVMVGEFGEVQVMDWGLAKVLADASSKTLPTSETETFGLTEIRSVRDANEATRAGSVFGTAAYMPREQAIGAIDQIDTRSDVFCLGGILCAILTGWAPYVGADAESTRQLAAIARLDGAFARLDACSAESELIALCKHCLSPERNDRPDDATAVAKAVADLRAESEQRARQAELDRVKAEGERATAEARTEEETKTRRVAEEKAVEQRKKRRSQMALAAVVLLVVVGGGIAAIVVRDQREEDRVAAEKRRADDRIASEEKRQKDLRDADEAARQKQRTTRAELMVQSLVTADTIVVPRIIDGLTDLRELVRPKLVELASQHATTKPGLHSRLALLTDEPGRAVEVAKYLPACKPEELLTIREFLKPHAAAVVSVLWAVLTEANAEPGKRVRAASALAGLTPDDPRWAEQVPIVIEAVVHANPDEFVVWSQALEPVRGTLLPALVKRYPKSRERIRSGKLDEADLVTEVLGFDLTANLLAKYAADRPEDLADLAMTVDPRHYTLISEAIEKNQAAVIPILKAELTRAVAPDLKDDAVESLAVRQANAAAALLKLKQTEPVWPLFKHRPDPRVRSYLIHRLGPLGANAKAVIDRLDEEPDVTIRRALLQSLGEYGEKVFSLEDRKALLPKLQEMYRTATDPGIHASLEWLLRTWKEEAWLKQVNDDWAKDKDQRDKRLEGFGKALANDREKVLPQWYVNGQGQTMVVIPVPVEFVMGSPRTEAERQANELQHKMRIGRTFALAATSVTKEQFLRYRPTFSHIEMNRYPGPTCPIGGVVWYEAEHYCNWLSKEEGIPEDQWCYEIEGRVMSMKEKYLSLTGYRLPTEAEMEYATRAGALTSRYFGESDELLPKYAWYYKNSQELTWPVGSLKPNDLGLFDVHGNVFTWCQETYKVYPQGKGVSEDKEDKLTIVNTDGRVLRGGSFNSRASLVRSATRNQSVPGNRLVYHGFRLARTFMP